MPSTINPFSLGRAAHALRWAHAAVSVGFLGAIGHIWWSALTGRRDRVLPWAVGAIVGEGVAVGLNGGDCPLGCLQERVGDPTPLFELVLGPRWAKRAVPILGAVAAVGIALLARRPRGGSAHLRSPRN